MLWPFGRRGDERQVDVRVLHRRELDLCLFGSFLQSLQRHLVVRQIHAFSVFEGLDQEIDDALVPVVTAKVRIGLRWTSPRRRPHQSRVLKRRTSHHQGSNTSTVCSSPSLVRSPCMAAAAAVGSLMIRSTSSPAILLPASCVAVRCASSKMRGDRDDRLGDGVTKESFSVPLQLLQNARGNLLGRVRLAIDIDGPTRAHVALRRSAPVRSGFVISPDAWQLLRRGLHRTSRIRPPMGSCDLLRRSGSQVGAHSPSRTLTTEFVVPRSIPTALGTFAASGLSFFGVLVDQCARSRATFQ